MPNREPIATTNLDTIYGSPTIPWSRPRDLLAVGALGPEAAFFLGTVRPDGRPHAAGIGAAWHDGDLYFQCGPKTRKARNLAANPACTVSANLPGMHLVFEGEARRVADTPTLEAVAAIYREGGWPVQVDGDAFTAPYSAPSAGPPPWHLFRLTAPLRVRRRDRRATRRDALALLKAHPRWGYGRRRPCAHSGRTRPHAGVSRARTERRP